MRMKIDCCDFCERPLKGTGLENMTGQMLAHDVTFRGKTFRAGFTFFVYSAGLSGKRFTPESLCNECILKFFRSAAEAGDIIRKNEPFIPPELFDLDEDTVGPQVPAPDNAELDKAFAEAK